MQHRPPHHFAGSPRIVTATLLTTIALSTAFAGQALGAPESQPGVTPPSTTDPGGQPGVTPTPEPAPAPPAPEPSPAPEPAPEYPQGIVSSPPQETAPVQWTEPEPQGPPSGPPPQLHAPEPTPPVAPKLVDIDHIRVGSEVFDRGVVPVDVAVSLNEYLAWSEAKIAQFYRSIGYSASEADEKAATAVVFGVIGGVSAAVAVGVPVFLATALFTVPIGAVAGGVIGSFVPPTGLNTVTGALIGAGAGAAVAAGIAALAALGAGTLGAALGVGLGYALGGGDPDANPAAPWDDLLAQWHDFLNPTAPPLPNPGGDQYHLVLDAPAASDAGLPAVDYTVNTEGDVNFSANIAGLPPINIGWTAEQAAAPYEVLGPLAEPAKNLAATATKQVGDGLTQVVDGLNITYPQTVAGAPA